MLDQCLFVSRFHLCLVLCLFSSVLKVRPVSFLGEPCYCTYNKEVIDTSRMEDYGEYVEEEEEKEIMEVVGKVLQRWESTGCDGGEKGGFRLSFVTMWAVLRAS